MFASLLYLLLCSLYFLNLVARTHPCKGHGDVISSNINPPPTNHLARTLLLWLTEMATKPKQTSGDGVAAPSSLRVVPAKVILAYPTPSLSLLIDLAVGRSARPGKASLQPLENDPCRPGVSCVHVTAAAGATEALPHATALPFPAS